MTLAHTGQNRLTAHDCSLDDFRAVVEQDTDPADYPHAEGVEQNVLVYGPGLRARIATPERQRDVQSELARALLHVHGIASLPSSPTTTATTSSCWHPPPGSGRTTRSPLCSRRCFGSGHPAPTSGCWETSWRPRPRDMRSPRTSIALSRWAASLRSPRRSWSGRLDEMWDPQHLARELQAQAQRRLSD